MQPNSRDLCVRATDRHVVPSDRSRLVQHLRLFPNVEKFFLDWETTLSQKDSRLTVSEDIHDFPGLKKLVIDSNPSRAEFPFGGEMLPLDTLTSCVQDLEMLFMHLPLAHVTVMELNLRDWINSRDLYSALICLRQALEKMRFPRLQILATIMVIEVRFVEGCIWVSHAF